MNSHSATAKPNAGAPATPKAVLLYDGACALCQASARLLRRLDWCGVLNYQDARDVESLPQVAFPLVPKQLLEEMHLLTPKRDAVYRGFYAFRWLAWRLPPVMLLAPLLYLPGVPYLGRRIYRWVARHRFNLVQCSDGACALPQKHKPA